MLNKLQQVEKELQEKLQRDLPDFNPGDTIRVQYRIKEGDKERLHAIEGVVIKLQGAMNRKAFTLRRIAYGEAYEVTIPYYSPMIAKIELVKEARRRPRRARLYYMRKQIGKEALIA